MSPEHTGYETTELVRWEILPSTPLSGEVLPWLEASLARWLGTLLGIVSGSNPQGSDCQDSVSMGPGSRGGEENESQVLSPYMWKLG